MTNCAKCGRVLTAANVDKANHGVVQWCMYCPRSAEYLWDRNTVNSRTNWVGGKATGAAAEQDDNTFDPRDGDVGEQFQ